MHSVQAGPGRAGTNEQIDQNKSCDASQRDSRLLMQKKYQNKQAPDRVLGIRRLLWCSPVSSTAAPQTCRRSPSPSRTQRSLPSKVKQINPRLLTYPPPRFPPTITTARSPFTNSDKTQKHKKTTAERLPPRFYLRIAFYVSLYFEGCSLFPPPPPPQKHVRGHMLHL